MRAENILIGFFTSTSHLFNSSETSECALTHFEQVGSVLLDNVDVAVDLCFDSTFTHVVGGSEGISTSPTHQAGWSTR